MTRETDASDGVDGVFGLAAGLYAAALVAPAIAIGVALRRTADPGVLFFTLLGTTVVVTAGVGWTAGRESLAVRLGASRWVWATLGLPFVVFGLLVAVGFVRGLDRPSPVVALALGGALAAVVVGTALLTAAHNRHARAVTAGAEELAAFRARAPEYDRVVAKWTVVALLAAGVLGFAGSALFDFEVLRWTFQILVPMGAALYGTVDYRDVTVSDPGLVVGNAVYRRLRPWSAFESYDVTDEAIVVRRAGWSAWGLLDVRRDPADVGDVAAVEEALDEVLPRRR